jgi:hypothetical protein
MPAAWQEPVDEADPRKLGPHPPSLRSPLSAPPPSVPNPSGPPMAAMRPPGPVPTPKPPRMAPPRFAVPPPNPLLRPTVPPYAQQPLTTVVPVAMPQPRPVSPIPYPGLPASAPPMPTGMNPVMAPGYAPGETHPLTGEPLSDRSSLTAGLLQVFLGAFGAGRLYTGHVAIALLQLMSGWFLFAFTMCAGAGLGTESVWALFWVGLAWPVIDGIVFLGYGGKDSKGRRLR